MGEDDDSTIGAVAKAFDIIDEIADAGSVGVNEVARATDLPKTTVYEHLQTLKETGYVTQRVDDGSYRLSLRFLYEGARRRLSWDIFWYGASVVDRVARETGERTSMVSWNQAHDRVWIIHTAGGRRAAGDDRVLGQPLPIHATAAGKVCFANVPADARTALLAEDFETHTTATLTDDERLSTELDEIREAGYAVEDGEFRDGVRSVAAAIMHDDDPAGAVACTGPAGRFDETYRADLAREVVDAASTIALRVDVEKGRPR